MRIRDSLEVTLDQVIQSEDMGRETAIQYLMDELRSMQEVPPFQLINALECGPGYFDNGDLTDFIRDVVNFYYARNAQQIKVELVGRTQLNGGPVIAVYVGEPTVDQLVNAVEDWTAGPVFIEPPAPITDVQALMALIAPKK